MHSAGQKELAQRASARSAEVRRDRVKAREEAQERAKLSLTQQIRLIAADRADEIAAALVSFAISQPNSAAMTELLNRVEGRVASEIRVESSDPFQMDEAQLQAWLAEPAADED